MKTKTEEKNTQSSEIEENTTVKKEEDNETENESTTEGEKTIISETSFTAKDGTENTATLFYDGDIRLSVNNLQTVIGSNVGEALLNNDDTNVPQPSYSLHTLGNQPLIAVLNDFPTVHGTGTKLDIFTYNDQKLKNVFSTSDIKFELDTIEYEKGEDTFSLPFANTTVTHVLTSEERAKTDEKLLEFENNNVTIDDEYIKTIKGGISSNPFKVSFTETDDDGKEEILISSKIQSVGAKTPVRLNTNAVFVFEIVENEIQFKDVTFENVKS
ncbi:hypothetical protein J2S77_001442 [Alkalibacillus salilacus]|uniref:Uncharacterized protein n=1 Tax=Alkalibacillus salilacus TaxID=284582 RepID=A0ABT9VES9_9BACI|nr:hypothetical protein [Alkalibacillus salilacus]